MFVLPQTTLLLFALISISSTVEAAYCCNRPTPNVQILMPGVFGLSNQLLDSPVKKLTQGKLRFSELVSRLQDRTLSQAECEQQLLELLCDDTWSIIVLKFSIANYIMVSASQLNNYSYSPILFFILTSFMKACILFAQDRAHFLLIKAGVFMLVYDIVMIMYIE